uniref:ATP synthase F0 subunit 8 n=1 Tax=Nesophrosyne sp. 15 GMB-2012 TaxID=1223909 RepID=UPI002181FBE3|nr:ATP synthase F0 subunit 8 [Nesophrosyne sp. 15 GMB-2012]UVI59825.1 ATP synthase F0 subunit 8 [Nesophrosyne sp. 15 GMB-2012]
MPQMAPMWWTTILLTSYISFMLMVMINYFSSVKKIKWNVKNKTEEFKWMWY